MIAILLPPPVAIERDVTTTSANCTANRISPGRIVLVPAIVAVLLVILVLVFVDVHGLFVDEDLLLVAAIVEAGEDDVAASIAADVDVQELPVVKVVVEEPDVVVAEDMVDDLHLVVAEVLVEVAIEDLVDDREIPTFVWGTHGAIHISALWRTETGNIAMRASKPARRGTSATGEAMGDATYGARYPIGDSAERTGVHWESERNCKCASQG
jgi:hypothetical protein